METKPFDLNNSPLEEINLIDASAGTGKTFTIEGIYVRLILEKGLNIENILVVTYTEAATNELRNRILRKLRKILGIIDGVDNDKNEKQDAFLRHIGKKYDHCEESQHKEIRQRLKSAIDTFDEAAIFTIHGFCQPVLADFAFETSSAF